MPPTTLGRLDLRPPEDLETGLQRLKSFEDALRSVQALGVSEPGLPLSGFRGEMPREITALDDEQLGDLLNNLSQWCGYIEFEYAKARAAKDEAEAQLEFAKARTRIAIKFDDDGKKLAAKDKDDRVTIDPKVVECTQRMLYTHTVYALTQVLREKSQRDWETVSRRITQRGQAIDRMKRENGVAGVPSPAQSSRTFRRPTH
jgi:hypothetical protein